MAEVGAVIATVAKSALLKKGVTYAKALLAKHIAPKLETWLLDAFRAAKAKRELRNNTVAYLAEVYARCSVINTIAFQNEPRPLRELFVPLTLKCNTAEWKIKEDGECPELLSQGRLIIVDDAGMGKSTLAKWIILNQIISCAAIPVFVELRSLANGMTLRDLILAQLGITVPVTDLFWKEAPFLFFFDGLDEIPADIRATSIEGMKDFIASTGSQLVVISSRPGPEVAEFHGFKQVKIKKLSRDESFSLIRKYATNGPLADRLIDAIKSQKDEGIDQFLGVPLYVTLLFCAYRYRPVIPSQRHVFYAHVYEALFEAHDLTKELGYVRQKHCKLALNDFSSVMRRLGFWCMRNGIKLQFTKDEFDVALKSAVDGMSGVSLNAGDFMKDLVETVPLFVRDGSVFRWAHKSLLEYFSAMFICSDTKGRQSDILLALANDHNPWMYFNILAMCCDIDYPTFRGSVVLDLLRRVKAFRDAAYSHEIPLGVTAKVLDERIGSVYGKFTVLSAQSGVKPTNFFLQDASPMLLSAAASENFNRSGGWQFRAARFALRSKSFVVVEQLSGFDCSLFPLIAAKEPALLDATRKSAGIAGVDKIAAALNELGGEHNSVVDFSVGNTLNKSDIFETVSSVSASLDLPRINISRAMDLLGEIERDKTSGLDKLLLGMPL